MSRVFEALTRAAEAKQRQPELSVEKIESARKNAIRGTILEANGTDAVTGETLRSNRTNGIVHETHES